MTPVDTATVAAHLGVGEREVRRQAAAGQLLTLGRWRTGRRGRPGLWFDLDNLRPDPPIGGLTEDLPLADIGV